jgi:Cd2+/Zn2+-exporting ATPase
MTQTEKIRLELPLVLPTVIDANDLCIDRLIKGLSGRGGIEKVHIKKADGSEPLLCLHYDPSIISVSRIRELLSQSVRN